MPFAKVGAMPQPSTTTSKHINKNGRAGGGSKQHRPKGITMEDLKKQTARRLAQEQNQVTVDPTQFVPAIVTPVAPLPLPTQPRQQLAAPSYRRQTYTQGDGYHRADVGYSASHYPVSSHQKQHLKANPPFHPTQGQNHTDLVPAMPPHQLNCSPPNIVQQHSGGYPASNYGSYTNPLENTQNGPVDVSQSYGGMTTSIPGFAMGVEHSQSSSSFPAAANPTKHKLPHGLTVHELKEMTKARLQAEAAENMEGEQHRERGVSPLDFDVASTGGASRDRAFSRDSASRGTAMYHTSSSMGVPQSVDGYSRRSVHSPTLRQVNRTDTWDSASVASFNSNTFSENLGTESVLEVSYELGSNNRARSFTVPALPSFEGNLNRNSWSNQKSSQVPLGTIGTPTFDAAVGGNRRRAVTLSPGTALILEDRPHHGTWTGDRLHISNSESSVGASASVQARQSMYSPVLEQLGFDGPFASERSDGDSAIGSNLFGSSLSDFQSTSLSSSEFTRGSSGAESRVPAPPPGFQYAGGLDMVGINHNRLASFSPHESVQDIFAGDDKNPWGAEQRHRLATVDNLTTDLGSILNLSGSDRLERNRANTYTFGSDLPMPIPDNGNATDSHYGVGGFP
ncbi:hypothetical protein IV203_001345 [Nitzschia inconspicua]|uniref:Uncharacterized protein n=1 Tax=Nitzschia inconspicua TaxID=303405 RepID=A0A9K3L6I9_9STRA|nr:hypothetical protein IV203_001345 [Nitzschia inconspicua]